MLAPVGTVPIDPCDSAAGTLPASATATAQGVIDAMRAWPGFEVTAATPIEIDGHAGQLVDVMSSRTQDDCPGALAWTTPAGIRVDAYPMVGVEEHPRAGTFRVVDVDGTVLIIRTTEFADASPHELRQGVEPDPERHAADLVELQHIVESIRIDS